MNTRGKLKRSRYIFNGKKLRSFRQRARLTLTQVSEETWIATSSISDYECGEIVPQLHQFNKLCKLFELDPFEICELLYLRIFDPQDVKDFREACKRFIYDADGNQADWSSRGIHDDKEKYLQQLIYTDKILIQVVDTILSLSKTPPVIIIQGDHGGRLLGGKDVKIEDYTILNAYYLPNGGDKVLYESIAPVNTFKVIFNYYFGADFKLIPEQPDFQPPSSQRSALAY